MLILEDIPIYGFFPLSKEMYANFLRIEIEKFLSTITLLRILSERRNSAAVCSTIRYTNFNVN